MCNHYRQAILRGERIPGWSIDQFSEIRIPIRFHNMAADVFPDLQACMICAEGAAKNILLRPTSPGPMKAPKLKKYCAVGSGWS